MPPAAVGARIATSFTRPGGVAIGWLVAEGVVAGSGVLLVVLG